MPETVTFARQQTLVLRFENGEFQRVATDPNHQIRWIAWRRDGRSALAVGNEGLILHSDGEAFDRIESPTRENLRCASYNPANQAIIVGNKGTVLQLENGEIKTIGVGPEANLRRVSWSPDGSLALVAGNSGSALTWQAGNTQELTGAFGNLRSITWHPEARHALVSGNYFGMSMVPCSTLYEYQKGSDRLNPLKTTEKIDLIGVEWKPDGEYALAVGYEIVWQEPRVFRWTKNELETVHVPEQGLYPSIVAWDPRGDRALIGTGSPFPPGQGEGVILEYRKGEVQKLDSSLYRITCIAWHPREDYAVNRWTGKR